MVCKNKTIFQKSVQLLILLWQSWKKTEPINQVKENK